MKYCTPKKQAPLTAKDVTRKLVRDIISECPKEGMVAEAWLTQRIGYELTAFADERVKEAIEEQGRLFQENVANFPKELKEARAEGYAQGCADTIHNSPMFEEGKKEGLEEAAKMIEGMFTGSAGPLMTNLIAEKIRAIKGKHELHHS